MSSPASADETPARILVVDDASDNLELLDALLKGQGHLTQLATCGQAALDMARAQPPDLILLDVSMPDMNGYQVCEHLRAEPLLRAIPVLFLSAMTAVTDKLRAFQAGGVDYITKPFELEEVAARVRTQLELGRQKRALEANLLRLQELEKLRDNLVHMIVHDLRSSLTGICLSLGLVEQNLPSGDSPFAGLLRTVQASVKRLNQMATHLLDINRLEAGQMPLQKQQSDLVQTAVAAVDSVSLLASDTGWCFEAPEPVRISHDPEIIRRVIENLLGNAIKFAPRGSEVKIGVVRQGSSVRVTVSDRGPGIAAESHQKIFEKFAQLEPQNRRLGAGLGLAFCKLAVEAHGGQIGVISEPGRGSAFWFTLPADR